MKRSGTYIKQVSGYKAFIPTPLPPEPPLKIETELQKLLSSADRSLAMLDGVAYTLPNAELFIAMYVKKEALLSSQIEGTQASLEDVFAFERGESLENINDVTEVINYVKALNYGMERLNELPMSLRLIKEIHAILLQGVRGENKTPGEFRKTQNWIGQAGCLLKDAFFVPSPPDKVSAFMGDLEKYIHSESIYPPLLDCALIHYQFETIHPFLDGNGRLGRLLITFYLYCKEIIKKPLLYLSYFFKQNRQEYYDRLELVRKNDDFEQWIKFFLRGIVETAGSAVETARRIIDLQNYHRQLLWKKRITSPLSIILLDNLFRYPIVTIKHVQDNLKISHVAAGKLLYKFEQIGILKELTGKQRDKKYGYREYLDILAEGTKPL